MGNLAQDFFDLDFPFNMCTDTINFQDLQYYVQVLQYEEPLGYIHHVKPSNIQTTCLISICRGCISFRPWEQQQQQRRKKEKQQVRQSF